MAYALYWAIGVLLLGRSMQAQPLGWTCSITHVALEATTGNRLVTVRCPMAFNRTQRASVTVTFPDPPLPPLPQWSCVIAQIGTLQGTSDRSVTARCPPTFPQISDESVAQARRQGSPVIVTIS